MTCLPVIKATSGWVQNGGKYLVYTDNRPNEKFFNMLLLGLIRASFPVSERKQEIQLALQAIP